MRRVPVDLDAVAVELCESYVVWKSHRSSVAFALAVAQGRYEGAVEMVSVMLFPPPRGHALSSPVHRAVEDVFGVPICKVRPLQEEKNSIDKFIAPRLTEYLLEQFIAGVPEGQEGHGR